jgi:hypothetical protein
LKINFFESALVLALAEVCVLFQESSMEVDTPYSYYAQQQASRIFKETLFGYRFHILPLGIANNVEALA